MTFLILLNLFVFPALSAPKEPIYLKVTKVKQAAMRFGKVGNAIVTATVGIGLHVQSNPASQPNLVATEVKLDPHEGFEIGAIEYPEGKPYKLQNSDRELKTYDGSFEIKVPIKAIEGKAKAGSSEIKGKLRFQACNDKICFFPTSVPLSIPIVVYK